MATLRVDVLASGVMLRSMVMGHRIAEGTDTTITAADQRMGTTQSSIRAVEAGGGSRRLSCLKDCPAHRVHYPVPGSDSVGMREGAAVELRDDPLTSGAVVSQGPRRGSGWVTPSPARDSRDTFPDCGRGVPGRKGIVGTPGTSLVVACPACPLPGGGQCSHCPRCRNGAAQFGDMSTPDLRCVATHLLFRDG
jgi:hypothetical protein